MKTFDAWHLPGLDPAELSFREYEMGDLRVRAPNLSADQLQRVIAHITEARRRHLARAPVGHIIAAIDAVASRIAAPESNEGSAARALLVAATGYSRENIEDILQHMTHDWSRPSLQELVLAEVGDAAALDSAVQHPRGGRLTRARGPRLAYHVFSGNVPGVAVTSIIRSLLVKAATLGKTGSGEPVLPILFARGFASVAPELAESLAVTYWPGGTESLEEIALSEADAIVVYGSEETVRSISGRARPDARLIVHGPRVSIGIVGRRATVGIAPSIARATAAFDQQGCVSPHVVYVEAGGSVSSTELARTVARELATLATTLPRGKLSQGEALAIRNVRARAEFRAIAGAAVQIFSSEDTSYTVIHDEDAALTTSCLNRMLYIRAIPSVEALLPLLEPHRHVLQSVAVAGFSDDQMRALAVRLADVGVTRITSFDRLPWPPMTWHHDGRGPLLELLTWHDIDC